MYELKFNFNILTHQPLALDTTLLKSMTENEELRNIHLYNTRNQSPGLNSFENYQYSIELLLARDA